MMAVHMPHITALVLQAYIRSLPLNRHPLTCFKDRPPNTRQSRLHGGRTHQ